MQALNHKHTNTHSYTYSILYTLKIKRKIKKQNKFILTTLQLNLNKDHLKYSIKLFEILQQGSPTSG